MCVCVEVCMCACVCMCVCVCVCVRERERERERVSCAQECKPGSPAASEGQKLMPSSAVCFPPTLVTTLDTRPLATDRMRAMLSTGLG